MRFSVFCISCSLILILTWRLFTLSAGESPVLVRAEPYLVAKEWEPCLINGRNFFYSLNPACWPNRALSMTGALLDLSLLKKNDGMTLLSPSWNFPSPTRNSQALKGFIPNLKQICVREVQIFNTDQENIAPGAILYGESDGGGFRNMERLTDGKDDLACSSIYPVIDKSQAGLLSFSFPEKRRIRKVAIAHGIKNGAAMASVAKDYQLQYYNGHGWVNLPDAGIKNNEKETTTHEFPAVETTAIRICFWDQSDLYDFRVFPFSIDNRMLNRLSQEKMVSSETPFYWWYLGHSRGTFFSFPREPRVDIAGYLKWKERYPNFFGFGLLEWDNDLLKCFVPMGRGWSVEVGGRPYTKAYLETCKNCVVEREFPNGYPLDRDEMVKYIEDEFRYQNKVLFDDAFMMLSHTTWYHYALEWGAKLFMLESTGGTPNREIQYAFARGISRTYQKPWGVYFAYFLGGGYLDYVNPPKKIDQNYSRGPECGISASSHRRQLYLAYLSGAAFFDFEHQEIVPFSKEANGERRLTPHGEAMLEVREFARKHPGRGAVYSPIGLLLDYAHGWTFWADHNKVFMGTFKSTDGDLMTDRVLYRLFPWDKQRYEEGNGYCMTNTPYGDIFDIVIPNPPSGAIGQNLLDNYKALFLLGDIKLDTVLVSRLIAFVANGGTLVVNAAQLDNQFPADFLGLNVSKEWKTGSSSQTVATRKKIDPLHLEFQYRPVKLQTAFSLVTDGKGVPLVAVNDYQKGRVIVMLQRYALADGEGKQLLPVFDYILTRMADENILPVRMEGNIEYILNKTPDGWWLSLFNNKGIYKKGTSRAVVRQEETARVKIAFREEVKEIRDLISDRKIDFESRKGSVFMELSIPPGEINILSITPARIGN